MSLVILRLSLGVSGIIAAVFLGFLASNGVQEPGAVLLGIWALSSVCAAAIGLFTTTGRRPRAVALTPRP